MDECTRALALANLHATREALQASVAGLSETQARFKPAPDRWNVEEIVEHVATAEHGMYRFITELHEVSTDPHEAESAASLNLTSDRKNRPLLAPERARPKGRYGSLDAALSQFLANRARTIAFIENCQDDLRFRLIQHPAGLLNAQDCLRVLTYHPARHVEQINELKSHPAFPGKEKD
jgi:hypothetical protein